MRLTTRPLAAEDGALLRPGKRPCRQCSDDDDVMGYTKETEENKKSGLLAEQAELGSLTCLGF
jgi:hypothetical protein